MENNAEWCKTTHGLKPTNDRVTTLNHCVRQEAMRFKLYTAYSREE